MDGLGFRQLIHKHFHIPGMMRHIGSRTGITRIQNIAHNVRFVSACHKENQLLGIKKQTAGHGYALLPIVGINAYLVRMERRKQILLTGENGRGMPVFSRPQQNNIKSRKAMPEWRIATHYARIAIRLIIGIVTAVNRKIYSSGIPTSSSNSRRILP